MGRVREALERLNPQAPFVRKSATSEAAAQSVEPKTGTQRRKVFTYLVTQGRKGATDEEIQLILFMDPSTERPRRVELVRAGLVVDSGEKRKTSSGRNAVVWKCATCG